MIFDEYFTALGFATLGNIEIGHDLEARNNGSSVAIGYLMGNAADPVDSVADGQGRISHPGLQVDIGGIFGVSVDQEFIYNIDNLRI